MFLIGDGRTIKEHVQKPQGVMEIEKVCCPLMKLLMRTAPLLKKLLRYIVILHLRYL